MQLQRVNPSCDVLILSDVVESAKHHVEVDIATLSVAERSGQRADDLETKTRPELNRGQVRGHDGVELHRAEAMEFRLPQRVFAQNAAQSQSATFHGDGIRPVGHMRTEARLVGFEDICAADRAIDFQNEGERTGLKPVRESLTSRGFWSEHERIPTSDRALE